MTTETPGDVDDLHREQAAGVGLVGDGDDVAALEALCGGDRELGRARDEAIVVA